MIPVDCTVKVHDPANGQIGDCHRACVASLLDLPVDDVPHFFDYPVSEGGERGLAEQEKWLAKRGLFNLELPFTSESLDDVLSFISAYSGDTYYMLVAKSRSGQNHCVIAQGNKIIHDPTYGNPHGVVGPAKDGYWWAGWLTLSPAEKGHG